MCCVATRAGYDSSLTDGQWAVIETLLPTTSPVLGGRPPVHDRRLVIDTILYVLVSGCQWRMLPHDLVPWQTAYGWFRAWTEQGVWDRVHDALRDEVRIADGRDPVTKRVRTRTSSSPRDPRAPRSRGSTAATRAASSSSPPA